MGTDTELRNMSTTAVVAGDSIHDLREQIFANAAALFPRVVEAHPSFQDGLIVKPSEVFDVIITRVEDGSAKWFKTVIWQAVLVYGDPLRRKIAAKGKGAWGSNDAAAALAGLLKTLADATGYRFKERKMEEPVKFGRGAVVDLGLT